MSAPRHHAGDTACHTSQQGRLVCTCAPVRTTAPTTAPRLDQTNSDGSCAHSCSSTAAAQDRPIVSPPWDSWRWVDELRARLVIGVVSALVVAAIFIAAGFLVGIAWHR